MFKERYGNLKIENTQEMIDMTARYTEEMGMNPYYLYRQKNMAGNFENVGYAAPGKECIYNILIMEEKQTIMASRRRHHDEGSLSLRKQDREGGECEKKWSSISAGSVR